MKQAISYGTFMGWLTQADPQTVSWFKDKGYWFASVCGPYTVEECNYRAGLRKPNYPLPATIGFQQTRYGTYLFDTRYPVDGMPLFRGFVFDYDLTAPLAQRRGWDWS